MERGRLVVLDTHAWIWWVSDPARLGRAGRQAITAARRVGVPAICCWELATLAAKGRITVTPNPAVWIESALALPLVELMPLTPAVAVEASRLGDVFPGDPADRMIVASAILENGLLITKDERLLGLRAVRSAW